MRSRSTFVSHVYTFHFRSTRRVPLSLPASIAIALAFATALGFRLVRFSTRFRSCLAYSRTLRHRLDAVPCALLVATCTLARTDCAICFAPAQPYATRTNRIRALNNGLRRCPTPISALAVAVLRPACDSLRNRCFSVLGLRLARRPVAYNHAFATAALPAAPGELLSQIRLLPASLGAFALAVDRLPPLSLAFAYESC
jgi:hypothetical protein